MGPSKLSARRALAAVCALFSCGPFVDAPHTARAAIGSCDPFFSCAESEVVGLAAGGRSTCALRLDGNVRCWGYNASGQLGDNSTTSRLRQVQVLGVNRATRIAVGDAHACEVESSGGGVRCWGSNNNGQLGDGTTVTRGVAAAVSGTLSATAVVAGTWHSCALTTAATVACWGANVSGSLGDGTTTRRTTPTAVVGLTGVVSLAAGLIHNCAVLSDGSVRCWGSNTDGQLGDGTTTSRSTPVAVPGITTAVEVVAGSGHTCVRLRDGTVRCWGRNNAGQLGNGATSASAVTSPVTAVGVRNTARLVAGYDFMCAATDGRDGAGTTMGVWCWGGNGYGQLGDATTVSRATPVWRASTYAFAALAGGNGHACTLDRDGEVRCTGLNNAGQFGNNSSTNALSPVTSEGAAQVQSLQPEAWDAMGRRYVLFDQSVWSVHRVAADESTVHPALRSGTDIQSTVYRNSAFPAGTVQVVGANGLVWALTSGGTLWYSSNPSSDAILSFAVDTRASGVTAIKAGGFSVCALISDRTVRCFLNAPPSTVTTPSVVNVLDIAVGTQHACALDTVGVVRCWGTASDGTVTPATAPRSVSLPAVAQSIDAAGDTTCARLGDNTVACWSRTGVGVTAARVTGVTSAAQLSVGSAHACVRNFDGTVGCWGSNLNAQLGRGTLGGSDVAAAPVSLLTRAVEVRAGIASTCARRVDGSVRCWGFSIDSYDYARLGDGAAGARFTMTPVLGASSIAAAASSPGAFNPTFMLDTAGNVLRIDNTTGRGLVAVPGFGTVRSLAVADHQCAATTGGAVLCQGTNIAGRLGNGTTTDSATPVVVTGLSGATQATVGQYHSCALAAGDVWCWGGNGLGQVGDGTTSDRSLPVRVLTGAAAVSARDNSTCALLTTGAVRCWGADMSATPSEPPSMSGLTATAVYAGSPACAVLSGRTVRCWGSNAPGASELAGFTSVARFDHTSTAECAVRTDGTLYCADRTTAGRVITGITDAADLTMNNRAVWVVRRGGSVLVKGANIHGNLGEGSSLFAVLPRPIVYGL